MRRHCSFNLFLITLYKAHFRIKISYIIEKNILTFLRTDSFILKCNKRIFPLCVKLKRKSLRSSPGSRDVYPRQWWWSHLWGFASSWQSWWPAWLENWLLLWPVRPHLYYNTDFITETDHIWPSPYTFMSTLPWIETRDWDKRQETRHLARL